MKDWGKRREDRVASDEGGTIEVQYQAALRDYVQRQGESALLVAYELGREAVDQGLGVMDVALLHHQALVALDARFHSHSEPQQARDAANAFLLECLSPFEMLFRGHAEANAALRRLNQVLEDEARRIGHTLHDEAGQLLATVYLEIAQAERKLPPEGRSALTQIRGHLDQMREQLRRLAHELRPPILDDLGLVPALEFLAEGVARRAGLAVRVEGDTGGRLGRECETALYRIVQEALANVVRHATATTAVVELTRRPGLITCQVSDDGCGFDVENVHSRRHGRGLGLIGIQERTVPLQGRVRIDSAPGKGTRLSVSVPLAE